jgi:hypothetical protein
MVAPGMGNLYQPFLVSWLRVNGKDRAMMTTITFKRSGGFVGKGMRLEVKLDELPGDEAGALLRLIEQAGFFKIPENLIVKFNPDEYQYTITVDLGVIYHTVRTNDTTMPATLRPLVEELSSLYMPAH